MKLANGIAMVESANKVYIDGEHGWALSILALRPWRTFWGYQKPAGEEQASQYSGKDGLVSQHLDSSTLYLLFKTRCGGVGIVLPRCRARLRFRFFCTPQSHLLLEVLSREQFQAFRPPVEISIQYRCPIFTATCRFQNELD